MWLLPLLLLIPLLLTPATAQGDHSSSAGGNVPKSKQREAFRRAYLVTGLGPNWMRFLEATASRESDFNPKAWNQTTKEKGYSRNAMARLSDKQLALLGGSRSAWEFGSRGLFQFLGPYVALSGAGRRFPASMTSPEMAWDPGIAMAAALSFARGVSQRKSFNGTWAGLVVGWGGGKPTAERLAKAAATLEKHGARLGYPAGWATEQIDPIPSYSQAALGALAGAARIAYYAGEPNA